MLNHAMRETVKQWYQSSLQALLSRKDRLPHAVLITGPAAIGKAQFASIVSSALLCKNPDNLINACGQCHACTLLAAGTHPDFYSIQLEAMEGDRVAKEIKVDQIRTLCLSLAQTSQLGGRKIVVIDPADKMNRNAANSLLKTLEEPGPETLLLLVTAQPSLLLPTIRSRCEKLALSAPPKQTILSWLQQQCPQHNAEALLAASDGAPLAALDLAESDGLELRKSLFTGFYELSTGKRDPILTAAEWSKREPEQLFRWFRSWMQDIIQMASQAGNAGIQNSDLEKGLHALASRIDLHSVFHFYDLLQRNARLVRTSANLQMLYESMLLEWVRHCAIKA